MMAQLPRPRDPYRAAKAAGKAFGALGQGIQEVAEVYRPEDERRQKQDKARETIEVATRVAYDNAGSNGGKLAAIVVGGGLLWWLLGKK